MHLAQQRGSSIYAAMASLRVASHVALRSSSMTCRRGPRRHNAVQALYMQWPASGLAARGRYLGTTRQRCSQADPLLLSYRRGAYHITLGSTLGQTQATDFSFEPATELREVAESVQREAGKEVSFTSTGGSLSESDTISDLAAAAGAALEVGRTKVPLVLSCGDVPDGRLEGVPELPQFLEVAKVIELKALLKEEKACSISWDRFCSLCSSCGIEGGDIRRVSSNLHKAGIIQHFHRQPELARAVHLRPEEVLQGVWGRLGIPSPLIGHVERRLEVLKQEETETRKLLDPLMALQKALDERAAKSVARFMWGTSGALALGAGFYWWLTYQFFSWDVMEPVTWITTSTLGLCGYSWWAVSNRDYEFSGRGRAYQAGCPTLTLLSPLLLTHTLDNPSLPIGLHDFLMQRSQNKLYKASELDTKELEGKQSQLRGIQKELTRLEDRKHWLETLRKPTPVDAR
ncbi:unnamed protein product [Chrysoparadoxa australica]